jgi:hypothetical protein
VSTAHPVAEDRAAAHRISFPSRRRYVTDLFPTVRGARNLYASFRMGRTRAAGD